MARNAGPLTYSVGPWVTTPTDGYVPGGFQVTVAVDAANANLPVGLHQSSVTLTSNSQTITLPVTLTVADAIGVLQANRKQLNFGGYLGDAIAAQNVGLSFTGANTANWTATGPAWLTPRRPAALSPLAPR